MVVLNLLIALMADSYSRIFEKAELFARIDRARHVFRLHLDTYFLFFSNQFLISKHELLVEYSNKVKLLGSSLNLRGPCQKKSWKGKSF